MIYSKNVDVKLKVDWSWIFRSILTPNSGHIDPQKN